VLNNRSTDLTFYHNLGFCKTSLNVTFAYEPAMKYVARPVLVNERTVFTHGIARVGDDGEWFVLHTHEVSSPLCGAWVFCNYKSDTIANPAYLAPFLNQHGLVGRDDAIVVHWHVFGCNDVDDTRNSLSFGDMDLADYCMGVLGPDDGRPELVFHAEVLRVLAGAANLAYYVHTSGAGADHLAHFAFS